MSLQLIVLTVVLLAGILLALILLKRKRIVENGGAWPYYRRRLLSQPEQVLFHRLTQALPEHCIFAQVQASRVLGVNKGYSFHEWNNKINRLSYDFVVCAKDASVVAVIELDDASHNNASRIESDAKKNRATAAAGITLLRWNVKAIPDVDAIRAAFLSIRSGTQGNQASPGVS